MDYKKLVIDILGDFLKEKNLELYDVSYVFEDNEYFLRVLIDNLENQIDLDTLAMVNEYLSERLDDDLFKDNYFLEVSSPGAERVLRNNDEIKKSIDKYVYVLADKEYLGYLVEAFDEFVVVKVNLKGRMKNEKIETKNIKLIRLAVKF